MSAFGDPDHVAAWPGRGGSSSRRSSRPACSPGRTLPSAVATADRLVALLDLARGPEERLDDLLGLEAGAGRRQVGADRRPLVADLVARQAGELRRGEDLGPAPGIALSCGPRRAASATCVGVAGRRAVRVLAAGGGTGVRGFGLRAGGLAVELGHEPVEAVEVVAEPLLGVVLGVAEDADRARGSRCRGWSAAASRSSDPWPSGRIFRPTPVAVRVHAVEVEGHEVGLHLREQARRSGRGGRGRGGGCRPCRRSSTPCAFSRSMIAIWFSGSPNQPPWL